MYLTSHSLPDKSNLPNPVSEPVRSPGFSLTVLFLSLQEKRIVSLDAANSRLMGALSQLKERYSMQTRNGISPTNPTKLQITENGEFRNSSNCWSLNRDWKNGWGQDIRLDVTGGENEAVFFFSPGKKKMNCFKNLLSLWPMISVCYISLGQTTRCKSLYVNIQDILVHRFINTNTTTRCAKSLNVPSVYWKRSFSEASSVTYCKYHASSGHQVLLRTLDWTLSDRSTSSHM